MNIQLLTQTHFEKFGESGFLENAASLMDENVLIFDNSTGHEWHGVKGYIQYLAEFVSLIPDLKSKVIKHQTYENKTISRLQMKGNFTGTLRTEEGIIFGNGNPIDIEYQIEQEFNTAGEVRRLVFTYDLADFIDQLSRRYRTA